MDPVKKKMIFFYAILGVVVFVMIYFLTADSRRAKKVSGPESVVVEIPSAKTSGLTDSKMDAYSQQSRSDGKKYLDDYWASLESSQAVRDAQSSAQNPLDVTSSGSGDSGREDGRLSDEELIRKYYGDSALEPEKPEEPQKQPVSQPSKPRAASSSGGGGGGSARPVPAPSAPAPVTEKQPEPEPERAAPVRSAGGVVSSMRGNRKAGVVSSGEEAQVARTAVTKTQEQAPAVPIRCMFVKDETIRSGQRVTVRVLDRVELDGVVIPEDTHLPAMCSLSGRLEMSITSFTMNGQLHTVNLVAYDNDGAKGLYCPGLDEIAQRSKEMGLNTAAGTVSTVIGGSGITGRLVQGAIRLGENAAQMSLNNARVTVPSGYTFYVMQEKKAY